MSKSHDKATTEHRSHEKSATGERHEMLPQWQRDNACLCEQAMLRILSTSGRLSRLAKAATVPGRKLRASLALQYLKWAGIDTGVLPLSVLVECLAKAEFLHSASCILDDIIDGDTVRRGQPVFHVREGLPQAILTAQELIGLACTVELQHPPEVRRTVQDALVASVRDALRGEACDSFPLEDTLKHLDATSELEEAYLQKTTPGFSVAYRIVGVVCALAHDKVDKLARFGSALGAYYQYANDYHDWFTLDARIRGADTEQVLVSLCIPTIIALRQGLEIRRVIGTRLQRKEFVGLVEHLRNKGIDKLAREKVRVARARVWELLPIRSRPGELQELLKAINSREFWGYSYTVKSQ